MSGRERGKTVIGVGSELWGGEFSGVGMRGSAFGGVFCKKGTELLRLDNIVGEKVPAATNSLQKTRITSKRVGGQRDQGSKPYPNRFIAMTQLITHGFLKNNRGQKSGRELSWFQKTLGLWAGGS